MHELSIAIDDNNNPGPASLMEWLQSEGFPDAAENSLEHEGQLVTMVQVYHEDRKVLEELAEKLQNKFPSLKKVLHHLPDSLWQQSWDHTATGFTTKLFKVSWSGPLPAGNQPYGLNMSAAKAFGNGQHATTQACLEVLENLAPPNQGSFLDIGAGTGILCLAAHYLGYQTIVATDIDETAIADCRHFFADHQVNATTILGSFPPTEQKFHTICCNVLYPELKSLAKGVAPLLHENGYFLTAGLIEKDREDFLACCRDYGLELNATHQCRHWLALTLTRH